MEQGSGPYPHAFTGSATAIRLLSSVILEAHFETALTSGWPSLGLNRGLPLQARW